MITSCREENIKCPARGGICSYEGGYTLPTKTLPPICRRRGLIGRGLWRATLRPDICLAPSEWGGIAVVRPCAINRGQLLTVAKLDGVIDFPNCRSRDGQPLHPWGCADVWGLSLRSPFDTYIIPQVAAKVN